MPVTVIRKAVNRRFPAAVNQGLSVAQGEYLVLLNNDAVVTDSWLDQLIALAEMKADLTTEHTESTEREATTTLRESHESEGRDEGLVKPRPAPHASPPQLVEGIGHRDMDEMQGFARRYKTHAGPGSRRRWARICSSTILAAGRSRGTASTRRLLQESGRKFAKKWGTAVGNQEVPLTPWVAEPRMETVRNWPHLTKNEQIWNHGKQALPAGGSARESQAEASE